MFGPSENGLLGSGSPCKIVAHLFGEGGKNEINYSDVGKSRLESGVMWDLKPGSTQNRT